MEVRQVEDDAWEAVADGRTAGRAVVWVRPDRRTFLHIADDATREGRIALVRAVPVAVDVELHTWVRESATKLRDALEEQGFAEHRREHHLTIDPVVAHRWLRQHPGPELHLVGVDELGLDRLRVLDEELREDVPGCDGWRWTADAFRAETRSAGHDGRLYRIAMEDDEPIGLVRVWVDQDAPRIGLVGVRRPHRGRGVARSLLGVVFAELAQRGVPEVVTEVDPTNTPVVRLMDALEARAVRTMVDHVRPARASV